MRHDVSLAKITVLAAAQVVVIVTALLVGGCVAKLPFKGNPDPNGPDVTATNPLAPRIAVMFPLDGKLDVFSGCRGLVPSLGKAVTVLYFRPRVIPVSDASLDSQETDIWDYFKGGLAAGDLGVVILRGVPPPPSTMMYSYVYLKNGDGNWSRVNSEDELEPVIRSETALWATLQGGPAGCSEAYLNRPRSHG